MLKTRARDIIYIVLFLVLVLALWTGFSLLPGPELVSVPFVTRGSHELAGLDLDDSVFRLPQAWETWTEKLYTPDELEEAEPPGTYDNKHNYATHRVILGLTPGVTYGITFRSSDYAMRLFVSGEEVVTVGNPAATESENVPQTQEVVYYFTPQEEAVELVLQSSNYVHYRDGAYAPQLVIGAAENIAAHTRNENLKTGIVFGCLIVAFLYHLAIFLLNRRQRASLLFAILCLLMALVSHDFPSLLLPEYNWFAANRTEYIIYIVAANVLLVLADCLFPGTVHRPVFWGYIILSGVYSAIILFTKSIFFTSLLLAFQIISVGVIIYGLIRLAVSLRKSDKKRQLAFLGIALFGSCIIYEILHRNRVTVLLNFRIWSAVDATTGMVLLVFCWIMVLSIDQAEVNRRLEEAKTALIAAEARYLALSAERQAPDVPVANLSDLGLTKRESDVALLLLDGKSRDEIAGLLSISRGTINTHCTNIYRKAQVSSVAEFTRLVLPGRAAQKEKPEI